MSTIETNLLGVKSILGLELDDIRGSKRSTMDRVFSSGKTPFTDHSSHLKKCKSQELEEMSADLDHTWLVLNILCGLDSSSKSIQIVHIIYDLDMPAIG